MIQQTVLPFKIENTRDLITSLSGLALWGEFAVGLGLSEALNQYMPAPGSAVGYKPSEHVLPLLLMLNGGGRSLEDLRQIRQDIGLREVLGLERLPSSDATGYFLRTSAVRGGLEGLAKVNQLLLKRGLKGDKIQGYTLDIDATGIKAEKKTARMTYKGVIGYMPIVGHLAEYGFVVGDEFRHGNESPGTRNLEFIKYCVNQLPEGKRVAAFRSDSAAYQSAVINYCEKHQVQFAIGADLDKSVLRAIEGIRGSVWRSYQNGLIGETVHCMDKTEKAFRLVVIRRPYQRPLFESEDISETYTVIATNRSESAEAVVAWYNQRGQCSENRIKELKIGFGMERMPCGQFEANALFFRIGVLAYNLNRLFVLKTLDKTWHRHQVQTLRWKLYCTAGKVVFHGRSVFLKIRRHLRTLFDEIRARSFRFASG